MASRTLTVKLVGDSSSVERMFGRVSGQASTFGRNVVRGATVAAGAVAGVGTAAFSVANTFADLSEAQSKAATVLGDGLDEVAAFAETAAERFGLSERAATEMAASFGQLLKPTVGATDELGNMTAELSGLAADLASFNNMNPEDVGAKLFSGLSGEAEPLKALGVFLTAATVEAKALELGLADASGEVSEAAKVQARYALILEQTADAHGDFARTAEGLPNQQRRMAAEWENLRAEIGERLAPVFANLLGSIMDSIPAMRDWASNAWDAITSVFSGDFAVDWDAVVAKGGELLSKIGEGIADAWENGTIQQWLRDIPEKIGVVLGTITRELLDLGGTILASIWDGIVAKFGKKEDGSNESLLGWLANIGSFMFDALQVSVEVLFTALGGLVGGLIEGLGLGGLFDSIVGGIQSTVSTVIGAINAVTAITRTGAFSMFIPSIPEIADPFGGSTLTSGRLDATSRPAFDRSTTPAAYGGAGMQGPAFGPANVYNFITPTATSTASAQTSNASTGVDPFGGIGGGAFVNLGIGG